MSSSQESTRLENNQAIMAHMDSGLKKSAYIYDRMFQQQSKCLEANLKIGDEGEN